MAPQKAQNRGTRQCDLLALKPRAVPTSLLMAGLHLFIAVSIIPVFQQVNDRHWWWATMKWNFVSVFHWNVLIYWTIVACNHALYYYRSYREHEIRTSYLEAQLAQAQLQALKMQLHPHFLFNTLHSVSALIHKDPDAADRMITRLGDFLRTTLENAGTQEITLQKEIEFINCYLEIVQIRFQNRLRVILNIEPAALDALVPNLLWQPILENASVTGLQRVRSLVALKLGPEEKVAGSESQSETTALGSRAHLKWEVFPMGGLAWPLNSTNVLLGRRKLCACRAQMARVLCMPN